ncbi:hypothetical protein [Massilia niastensis]|uniref:hypothetical protein n=1 Tax=Massilia niastensis TaxID=544911 RepID=UPI00039BE031|nr:hypothetical protein [Massilia niastensis]
MSQAAAVHFPLPAALALAAVVLVLLALGALVLRLRRPAPVRVPAWVHGREGLRPGECEELPSERRQHR